MRQIVLFFAFVCAASTTAHAQSPVMWNQSGAGNSPFVQQAILAGNGAVSTGSDVTIMQVGSANQLTFRSRGEANTANFRQTGDANQIELNLIGNGNRYLVDQTGNRNVLSLPDVRSVNADVQLIQRGDGNQLIREGSLSVGAGVQMRIEQTGGMKIMLTNGRF